MNVRLTRVPGRYAVCRLAPSSSVPAWVSGAFTSVSRTPDELSIICEESAVPPGIQAERGWCAMRVEGPLPFDAVGIAAALAAPLAAERIPILLIGTHDTDYLLVSESVRERAEAALTAAGHRLG